MTDADVDGAHSHHLTFSSPRKPVVEEGHIYLALPPLFKISYDANKNSFLRLL